VLEGIGEKSGPDHLVPIFAAETSYS
jgi:hypothetical protein